LLFLRRNSAQLRYIVSFVSLIVLLGWSGTTFVQTYRYAKEKAVLRGYLTSDPEQIRSYLNETISTGITVENPAEESVNFSLIKVRSYFQRHFYPICFFWLVGILFLLLRLIGGLFYAHRLRTQQLIDIGEEWMKRIEAFSEKLDLKRKVQAFFSPLARVPLTLGTLKPIVLFPIAAFNGLSVKDVEAIIAHELAHVARHDYLFNIVQSVCEILFFYHPGVWIISSQIRAERENSCDNIAIGLTGDKLSYAKALAAVQIQQMEQGQLAMAFASSRGSILQRIKRLQTKVAMKTNFIEGLIAAAVVVGGLTLASFTLGNENETTPTGNIAVQPLPIPESRTMQEVDSIRASLEENVRKQGQNLGVTGEVGKMMEVALSEPDHETSAAMMASLDRMLTELDLERIMASALDAASFALDNFGEETWSAQGADSTDREARIRDKEEARKEIEEARRAVDEQRETLEEARREIEEARREMQEARREALNEIDYDEIRRDMEEARRDIEEARKEIEEARREMEWEMRQEMGNEFVPEGIIDLSIEAAQIGLDVASSVLEHLNIEAIVEGALRGVAESLESIGEIEYNTFDEEQELSQEEIDQLMNELKSKEEKIKQEKEALKQKEKERKKKEKNKESDPY